MNYYVYELIDPRNNKVFYIGKGQKKRMYKHVMDVRTGHIPNITNTKLGNKIKKILATGLKVKYIKALITENEQKAFAKEMSLIKKIGLKNLCNMSVGGVGGCNGNKSNKGRTFTAEHRKKISDSVKIAMAKLPNDVKLRIEKGREKGRICLEETKRKISLANKGKTGGPHNLGRIFTADHKQKISDSVKRYFLNKKEKARTTIRGVT